VQRHQARAALARFVRRPAQRMQVADRSCHPDDDPLTAFHGTAPHVRSILTLLSKRIGPTKSGRVHGFCRLSRSRTGDQITGVARVTTSDPHRPWSAHPAGSSELADPAKRVFGGIALGQVDVIHQGTIPEPDQAIAPGGDLRIVGRQHDRHPAVLPEPGQQGKPDRVVHRLTPAGREELDRWLSTPSARTRGYRDDFFLKVVAAVQAGDPAMLDQVIGHQRAHLVRELRSLHEAGAAASQSPVDALLVTAAELHVRADPGVVDAVESGSAPMTTGHCG
jgi:hypothetical protein